MGDADHRRFEKLLEQGEASTDRIRKTHRGLLATLTSERICTSSESEEKILHPALQSPKPATSCSRASRSITSPIWEGTERRRARCSERRAAFSRDELGELGAWMLDLESSVERALARQTILGPPLTEGPSRCRVRHTSPVR